MCEPVSLAVAGLAMTGVTSITQYVSGKRQAEQANEESKAFYEANKAESINAANLNIREIGLRESEELLATAAAQQDSFLNEHGVLSTARVAAAEAGISGNSVAAMLNDISTQGSRERVRMDANLDLTTDQLQREKDAVLNQARSNIAAVRQTEIRGPSILTPILAVGGAGLQAATYLNSRKPAGVATPKPIKK